ncbi:MAG: hypothetical protein LBJ70_00815 [Holosporales bacterium]|nr:hypothetical protein [Holosporales bacterium]
MGGTDAVLGSVDFVDGVRIIKGQDVCVANKIIYPLDGNPIPMGKDLIFVNAQPIFSETSNTYMSAAYNIGSDPGLLQHLNGLFGNPGMNGPLPKAEVHINIDSNGSHRIVERCLRANHLMDHNGAYTPPPDKPWGTAGDQEANETLHWQFVVFGAGGGGQEGNNTFSNHNGTMSGPVPVLRGINDPNRDYVTLTRVDREGVSYFVFNFLLGQDSRSRIYDVVNNWVIQWRTVGEALDWVDMNTRVFEGVDPGLRDFLLGRPFPGYAPAPAPAPRRNKAPPSLRPFGAPPLSPRPTVPVTAPPAVPVTTPLPVTVPFPVSPPPSSVGPSPSVPSPPSGSPLLVVVSPVVPSPRSNPPARLSPPSKVTPPVVDPHPLTAPPPFRGFLPLFPDSGSGFSVGSKGLFSSVLSLPPSLSRTVVTLTIPSLGDPSPLAMGHGSGGSFSGASGLLGSYTPSVSFDGSSQKRRDADLRDWRDTLPQARQERVQTATGGGPVAASIPSLGNPSHPVSAHPSGSVAAAVGEGKGLGGPAAPSQALSASDLGAGSSLASADFGASLPSSLGERSTERGKFAGTPVGVAGHSGAAQPASVFSAGRAAVSAASGHQGQAGPFATASLSSTRNLPGTPGTGFAVAAKNSFTPVTGGLSLGSPRVALPGASLGASRGESSRVGLGSVPTFGSGANASRMALGTGLGPKVLSLGGSFGSSLAAGGRGIPRVSFGAIAGSALMRSGEGEVVMPFDGMLALQRIGGAEPQFFTGGMPELQDPKVAVTFGTLPAASQRPLRKNALPAGRGR